MNSSMQEIIEISQKLIRAESVTPSDGGTLEYIAEYLANLGFKIEYFNKNDVKNLYATIGSGSYLCFAGHVDVVPPGVGWRNENPYSADIEDGFIYGRGTNDMKITIACAMVVFKEALRKNPNLSLAILLTSDEEAIAEDGIKYVVPILQERAEPIRVFILGEPTCEKIAGDLIKIGRRGSMTAVAKIKGIQGHIAYPQHADNPLNKVVKICDELMNLDFNDYDEILGSSKLQVTNIDAFNKATNVIPGVAEIRFGIRFNHNQTQESIRAKIDEIFAKYANEYEIEWRFHGASFVCKDEKIRKWLFDGVVNSTGIEPKFDGTGATSDGRFLYVIADSIEIGFQENMAHKVNERVAIEDIERIYKIYTELIERVDFIL